MRALARATMRLRGRITEFARDRRGAAAVEFAMLLPLMMTLFLGGVEVSEGVGAKRKTTLVARAVADLAAQSKKITNADMQDIFNAARVVAAPFPTTPQLKVVVSSIAIDGAGVAKVAWSDALNATARAVGATVTVPDALKSPNTTLIWAEATYDYTPAIGYALSGTFSLTDKLFMRPRYVTSVPRTAT